MTKSLASWKMNVNLARIQSVIIKQTFEELSLIRSGSIYGSGRIIVDCSGSMVHTPPQGYLFLCLVFPEKNASVGRLH